LAYTTHNRKNEKKKYTLKSRVLTYNDKKDILDFEITLKEKEK